MNGQQVHGIGRIAGPYFFEPTAGLPHRRPVEWLDLSDWRLPLPESLLSGTIRAISTPVSSLLEIERRIAAGTGLLHPHPTPRSLTSQHARPILPILPRLIGVAGRVQAVLERKGQVILYGPPGTGKTYWAERTAHDLAAYTVFGQPFDQLDESKRVVVSDSAGAGLVRMCTFHPNYGYEDFLEGYRPEVTDGQMTFRQHDGIFKRVCADAEAMPNRRFYLVIDEINRGDIPRIFGELLTVLEKSKRGWAILLATSSTAFRIPPNVFLIGTMNTADRSIALLDTALRRRFGFIELMPDYSLLEGTVIGGLPLGPWLTALNRRICEHLGRDGRNLQIGHSYFLDGELPVKTVDRFAQVIREDVLPLLEEYCYEDFATLERIIGAGLIDAAGQQFRDDLFASGSEKELIQHLLAPNPELASTYQAVSAKPEEDEDSGESDEE